MSAKKMGRPVLGKPKIIDLKVRVDKELHEKLVKYAENNNQTKAEVARRAITIFLEKE
ncbi:MAG: hypothetical protein ACLTJQ_07375 [Dialister invisus]|uniref:hypothetical protein n=1 Tax=Dialister invisus TaxID=218538 RepID=UPI0039951D76